MASTRRWIFLAIALGLGLAVALGQGLADKPRHTCNCAACEQLTTDLARLSGRSAVIDLDRVAREMGWTEAIQESMQVVIRTLQAEANQAKAQLDATIEAERKRLNLPEDPSRFTDEQRKQYTNLQQALQRQVAALQQNYNQRQQAAMREQVNQYRDEIKPKAKEVARELGLSIVQVSDNSLLYFADSVDITSRVIEVLQKDPTVKGRTIKQYVPVPTTAPAR